MKGLTNTAFADASSRRHSRLKPVRLGFIECSARKDRHFALAFEEFCENHTSKLGCGGKVQVFKAGAILENGNRFRRSSMLKLPFGSGISLSASRLGDQYSGHSLIHRLSKLSCLIQCRSVQQ